MKPTQKLRNAGQSLWLDNITRAMLHDGTLKRYIEEFSITGLTANPTIYDHAMRNGSSYDDAIMKASATKTDQELFFDLAIDDLTRAADFFGHVYSSTAGVDGWVSLELSPLLAYDAARSLRAAIELSASVGRPNFFVKIPGTPEGLAAIEECIFAGVPINVTLLFSRQQYLAAAEAYMSGIERRIEAGLAPDISSVASVFVSRWDHAVANKVPDALRGRLGKAIAGRTYKAYRDVVTWDRWQRLANFGAKTQRLLWASTSTRDPAAPDTLYVSALAAPHTINTMPDKTLLAFADHGQVDRTLPANGGDAESVIAEFEAAGIDCDALALWLQSEGVESFTKSWNDLMSCVAVKRSNLTRTASVRR